MPDRSTQQHEFQVGEAAAFLPSSSSCLLLRYRYLGIRYCFSKPLRELTLKGVGRSPDLYILLVIQPFTTWYLKPILGNILQTPLTSSFHSPLTRSASYKSHASQVQTMHVFAYSTHLPITLQYGQFGWLFHLEEPTSKALTWKY